MTLLFKRRAIRRLTWLSWVFQSERKENIEKILPGGGRKGREERSTVVGCFFDQQWPEVVVGEEESEAAIRVLFAGEED
ncbi:hypothetical protein HAX54_009825, partial [Datura stramonium]|nr:hypothetical protein [Datura stramonium]